MLKSLDIENIAVIEKAGIEFSFGLNVLTGETGAGKSILVDAISAVLGERTSKELVRNGADNAFVSALFEDVNSEVTEKLTEMDIPFEEDNSLIISRRISSTGKSSCKVNGRNVTVSMLKELGMLLVNIHGQHDSQALLNPDYHYEFLDMTGDDNSIIDEYKASFKELISIRKRLKKLTEDADNKERELEILEYQIKEISESDIKIGEIDSLNERKKIIQSAAGLISALNSVLQGLSGDDETAGAQSILASSQNEIKPFAEFDKDFKQINDLLYLLYDKSEELKDAALNKLSSIEYNENELEIIEERLNLLYNLVSKYGGSEEAVLEYLKNAEERKRLFDNSDEEIEKLSLEYDSALDKTLSLAEKLSSHRRKLADKLEKDVKEQLVFLDMPKIQFKVDFEKSKLTSNGFDKIEFLISTNPGEPPKPLAKIASGGELSRIMLAIKNIIAKNDRVQTLIFDEIDTGVSGRASTKIGLKLKEVSKSTQVICVTHSAQIASAADMHLLISKHFENDKTYTKVSPLDFEQRKHELARIMGGLEITDNLLQSAEELLNNYQQ
ncbi:MAG: DNA repair protein RecN [Ruminococcaceae bacterium]|nr:DNA repair protein RecN [Oscillospiraceae bacterium]